VRMIVDAMDSHFTPNCFCYWRTSCRGMTGFGNLRQSPGVCSHFTLNAVAVWHASTSWSEGKSIISRPLHAVLPPLSPAPVLVTFPHLSSLLLRQIGRECDLFILVVLNSFVAGTVRNIVRSRRQAIAIVGKSPGGLSGRLISR